MPNEPLSPRPIRLSQKLRGLSRLRSRGIEDKGETEEFRMVHTPDRPHRIITPVEAPSEEECGDTISNWHKAVKDDSDSEGEEEKLKPARSFWKTPDYTGGHPGKFQSHHHEPHVRGNSQIYTPSGLSQEVHVDSFHDRSRDVRRSVSEHQRGTFSESPVPRPLVPDKSKQRQKHLHHTPSPPVKQSMERDISRGRGREKGDQPKPGGAATHSLPGEYRIQAMELQRRGQCPYCRCQLGNGTYLTCPNPPCGKGLTTFEGSWIAPPRLKDRRHASPSRFGFIGRQLFGRPLRSSPDSIGSLPSQQKRSGTNTPEALATLPESIASIGTQRYRTPPPPPTSTSRQAQRAKQSSAASTARPQFAQPQGQPQQAPHRQATGSSDRERRRPPPPPVYIQQHARFEHITPPYHSSGSSSGASTPTPSHSPSPGPLRSAPPPQITLPLRPAAPPSQPLRSAPPTQTLLPKNSQQTTTKQPLVSKFSTSHPQPSPQPPILTPQKYPPNHITSAISTSLPPSQSKKTSPGYLDWIPLSERSLFYPYSSSTSPAPPPPQKSSSRRRSKSQQPPPPSQQPQSHFSATTTHSSASSQDDYLADIYDQYGSDHTTKASLTKHKSWTSSKYSTDTVGEKSSSQDMTDDDDNWNQLEEDGSHDGDIADSTPTKLRPTPPLSSGAGTGGGNNGGKGGSAKKEGRGKGGYKSQAENKGLRVATGRREEGREVSKDRLAKELELRRMKWL
ncbi:hypothetical protein QBC40DRAFT_315386 [Triangularia verruculosa]|uniref:Uncharacterized protein n=1 Tax=Triangularia verruculosa TaxID=2587418 RepID=A0AAN6XNR7_9PEZI|nr:hypothetical protein QBC40DRAFT_315386 [Triangularia verruculosa]